MSEIQRYYPTPTYTTSMATMVPTVALVKHPEGHVVLFADHQRILAEKDSEIERLKGEWSYRHMTALRNAIAATDENITGDQQLLDQPAKLKAERDELRTTVERLQDDLKTENLMHLAAESEVDSLQAELDKVVSQERNALRLALEDIRMFAIHGCGTKQKDARGRIFNAIVDKVCAALASPEPSKELKNE